MTATYHPAKKISWWYYKASSEETPGFSSFIHHTTKISDTNTVWFRSCNWHPFDKVVNTVISRFGFAFYYEQESYFHFFLSHFPTTFSSCALLDENQRRGFAQCVNKSSSGRCNYARAEQTDLLYADAMDLIQSGEFRLEKPPYLYYLFATRRFCDWAELHHISNIYLFITRITSRRHSAHIIFLPVGWARNFVLIFVIFSLLVGFAIGPTYTLYPIHILSFITLRRLSAQIIFLPVAWAGISSFEVKYDPLYVVPLT